VTARLTSAMLAIAKKNIIQICTVLNVKKNTLPHYIRIFHGLRKMCQLNKMYYIKRKLLKHDFTSYEAKVLPCKTPYTTQKKYRKQYLFKAASFSKT
jgi:hypothetical protein